MKMKPRQSALQAHDMTQKGRGPPGHSGLSETCFTSVLGRHRLLNDWKASGGLYHCGRGGIEE